jgi:D-3-phosphoglycerate dehydrogenase
MIRILITDRLSPKVIDLLNEIPEFEVSEKPGLTSAQLRDEIANADALVISGYEPLPEDILNQGGSLKLVVRCGDGCAYIDNAAAKRRKIEIHTVAGGGRAQHGKKTKQAAGIDVIAILKDFFNV